MRSVHYIFFSFIKKRGKGNLKEDCPKIECAVCCDQFKEVHAASAENVYWSLKRCDPCDTSVKIQTDTLSTPAMQAGLMKRVMSIEDIANLVVYEAPKKRGSSKKITHNK